MAASEPTAKAGDMPALISEIAGMQDKEEYEELNWEGSFEDYLEIVRENPPSRATRSSASTT